MTLCCLSIFDHPPMHVSWKTVVFHVKHFSSCLSSLNINLWRWVCQWTRVVVAPKLLLALLAVSPCWVQINVMLVANKILLIANHASDLCFRVTLKPANLNWKQMVMVKYLCRNYWFPFGGIVTLINHLLPFAATDCWFESYKQDTILLKFDGDWLLTLPQGNKGLQK